MKLEHLLQAYKVNNIEAEVKDMSIGKERAGVINFTKGISASYLLDDEEIVVAMKMFFNCLNRVGMTVTNQINHVINVITIMQRTMMLLGNITQHEANMILEKLGIFDETFKEGKQIKHLSHIYKLEVVEGILCLSISEIEKE